jgi:uncharacterized protein YbcI
MAQRLAEVAGLYQQKRTGRAPKGVTVAVSGDTLVITLNDALTPAEQKLAQSAEGAARLQEYHRQLFADSVDPLRREIEAITGVAVREAAAEIDTTAGAVVHAFTSGTVVQVFLLAESIPEESWRSEGSATADGDEPTCT